MIRLLDLAADAVDGACDRATHRATRVVQALNVAVPRLTTGFVVGISRGRQVAAFLRDPWWGSTPTARDEDLPSAPGPASPPAGPGAGREARRHLPDLAPGDGPPDEDEPLPAGVVSAEAVPPLPTYDGHCNTCLVSAPRGAECACIDSRPAPAPIPPGEPAPGREVTRASEGR